MNEEDSINQHKIKLLQYDEDLSKNHIELKQLSQIIEEKLSQPEIVTTLPNQPEKTDTYLVTTEEEEKNLINDYPITISSNINNKSNRDIWYLIVIFSLVAIILYQFDK